MSTPLALLMSMREDGIEVDQIALTTDVTWRPDGSNAVIVKEPASARWSRPDD